MDAHLSSRITAILQSRERGPPFRTTEILSSLGRQFLKRDVNRELYSLQRRGAVVKVSEVPPMWRLVERGAKGTSPFDLREQAKSRGMAIGKLSQRGRGASGRQRYPPPSRQPQSLATGPPATHADDVESRLLRVFQSRQRPLTIADFRSGCPSLSPASVTATLSRMQRNNIVRKVFIGSSCSWVLVRGVEDEGIPGVISDVASPVQQKAPPARCADMVVEPVSVATTLGRGAAIPSRDRMRESLLEALSCMRRPLTALELAKSLGLPNRSSINPDLYQMASEGSVEMVTGAGPPKWRYTRTITPSHTWQVQQQPPPMQETLSTASDSGSPRDSMETDSRSYDDDENMDEQDSPYQVDLSSYPEGDVNGRVLAVLHAYPTKLLTSLDIAQASKTGKTRAEVDNVLRELERSERSVRRTHGQFPTLWGLPDNPKLCQQLSSMQPNGAHFPRQQVEVSPTPPLGARFPPQQAVQVLPMPSVAAAGGDSSPAVMQMAASSQSDEGLVQAVTDLNRNPVSTLSEYCQSNRMELSFPTLREFGAPHRKHFVVGAVFGDLVFESESTNKKEAKRAVAEKALQYLRANQLLVPPKALTDTGPTSMINFLGTSFHDKVARLAHDMHAALESRSPVPLPGRKVIACFIMEDLDTGSMTVVSFGSGTRCITGDQMSLRGDVVNDSHAEVVARRGLMRFLYRQLFGYHGNRGNSGLETIFTATEENGVVRIRDGIQFHLYISTAPCGDGAQFSREEQDNRLPPDDGHHSPTMQSKLQGLLRTKMEGGEGTIPMGTGAQPQTWDGILQGGRLRTMSCSDKVGRWNILGLQGALLSLFMRPVYMSSLTLGSLHHHGHLSRAVCCRFSDLASSSLPEHFKVNHPLLGRIRGGDEMKRHVEKTNNHCMNWVAGDDTPEVTVGPVGRPVSPAHASPPPHSRVCKAELYALFLCLCKMTHRKDLLSTSTYQEAKLRSTKFQEAKSLLYKLCESKGYGTWMKKPPEQEMFGPSVLEQLKIAPL